MKIEVPNWMREMPPFEFNIFKHGLNSSYNNLKEQGKKDNDSVEIDIIRRSYPILKKEYDKLMETVKTIEEERSKKNETKKD